MPSYWGFNPSSYDIKIVTNLKENKVEVDYVVYNNPATIVMWSDGTKTVVKTTENDTYDPVVGFLMAYYQKHSGKTKTQVGKFMDKVIRDCQEQEEKRNKKKIKPEVKSDGLKVGDRIIVVNSDHWNELDKSSIDYYIGKIGTIATVLWNDRYTIKFDEKDVQAQNITDGVWYFKTENLKPIE